MEKAFKMGKASATGSFQLLVGVAASTIIMAVGTIVLARLMSPAEYGLYAIAIVPSMMINMFRDWGVNSAMTKYIANFRVANKDREIPDVIVAGLIFEVATGLALSFLSVFLANFVASVVFHRPESAFFISIVSVTIISGSLLTASQSCFIGFERMGLNSFTVICQSIVKTLVGPLLVLFGYGVLGAVLGYTVSFLATGIISLGVLYVALFRPLKKSKVKMSELTKTLKEMLKYGVPLSISSILIGVLGNFYSFMMAYLVSDTMIGNYHATVNFAALLGFFTMPISTVLFPAFAKLNPQNERQLLKTVFTSSIKYASMLLVPATMAVMALSGPMISTLFGEKYVCAPFFLTIYVISNLFVVLGNLSLNSFLTGLGETKIPMKQGILTLSIGIPLGFFLIPMFGILGLILATLLASLPSMFWGLYWTWKHYEARADFKSSARILIASTIATFATYLLLSFFNTVAWVRLMAGGAVFLAVYILTAPMIGAITQTDVGNLRTMLSGLGIISRMLTGPLVLVEKVAGHAPTSAGWKNRSSSKSEKNFE